MSNIKQLNNDNKNNVSFVKLLLSFIQVYFFLHPHQMRKKTKCPHLIWYHSRKFFPKYIQENLFQKTHSAYYTCSRNLNP